MCYSSGVRPDPETSRSSPASIRGRVLLSDGTPVADVPVLIISGPTPLPDIAALTADDGSFRFDDLDPGSYGLLVNAEGFDQITVTLEIETGESAERSIVLY